MAPRIGWCAIVVLVLAVAGARHACATDLEGRSGPFGWRIADVRQSTTTVDGALHARHEFTLVVKNVTTRTLTLRSYSGAMSFAGIPGSDATTSLDATMPPGAEYKVQLYAFLPCLDTSAPCRVGLGPAWLVTFDGRDSGGDFSASIDVTLPVESGRPVVPLPKLKITRAPAAGAASLGARFTGHIVTVAVSMAGEELRLIVDTGSQISMLRPEVARRLGLVVEADTPRYPVAGLGGRVNAALLEWPPLRLGDYVVEHVLGGVAAFPEFSFSIDGVLGGDLLGAFRVTIDQKAKELRLEPSQ